VVLGVSELVKDVAIPVVAAIITAVGIVVPLLVQRSRDRNEEAEIYQKALESIYRDASFLVEQVQLAALRHAQQETVSSDELAATTSASTRLFSRLFDDPRIFDSYFHGSGTPGIANESKLLLLLGELEVRLKRLATPEGLWFTLFAAQFVKYFGEEDEEQRRDLREALRMITEQDPEAKALASAICPELLTS
jgi:hypothetical protein